jgi:hypothetical protein
MSQKSTNSSLSDCARGGVRKVFGYPGDGINGMFGARPC